MIWIAKSGQKMLVDPGTLPYWEGLGWQVDADANAVGDLTQLSATYEALVSSSADGHAAPRMSRLDLTSVQQAGNALTFLPITTYVGGTNEVTEPSVYFNPAGFAGYRYWMAAVPYENANAANENPSIWCSQDGQTWSVPPGVTNPLVAVPSVGNHADPHLIEVKSTLYLVYVTENQTGNIDTVDMISSTDGVTWTAPVTLLTTGNTGGHQALSPAPWFDGTTWHLWALDTSTTPFTITHRTASTLTGTWSAPATTSLVAPAGKQLWEMEVKRYSDEWVCLLTVTDSGQSGVGGQLYLATSTDGITWTMTAAPVVDKSTGAWDASLYKSTFVLRDTGKGVSMAVWYGSAGGAGGNIWHIGYTTVDFLPVSDHVRNAANVTAALRAIPPYTLGDSFDRADAAVMGTADSGQTYTTLAGVPGIVSKQAAATTAVNTKAVTTGNADGYTEITVAANDSNGWLMFRCTDTSNYWRFGFSGPAGANVALQKIVAGASTTLQLLGNLPVGTRFGVKTSGTSISIYTNGVLRGTYTDSFNQAATLVGFQSATLATRFDNLWSRALVNGV